MELVHGTVLERSLAKGWWKRIPRWRPILLLTLGLLMMLSEVVVEIFRLRKPTAHFNDCYSVTLMERFWIRHVTGNGDHTRDSGMGSTECVRAKRFGAFAS